MVDTTNAQPGTWASSDCVVWGADELEAAKQSLTLKALFDTGEYEGELAVEGRPYPSSPRPLPIHPRPHTPPHPHTPPPPVPPPPPPFPRFLMCPYSPNTSSAPARASAIATVEMIVASAAYVVLRFYRPPQLSYLAMHEARAAAKSHIRLCCSAFYLVSMTDVDPQLHLQSCKLYVQHFSDRT